MTRKEQLQDELTKLQGLREGELELKADNNPRYIEDLDLSIKIVERSLKNAK